MSQPELSYLICSTARTGSTLLCQLLTDTGIAGQPDEYFCYLHDAPRPPWVAWLREPQRPELLAQLITQHMTPNGVFGANVIWQHFDYFLNQLRYPPDWHTLATDQLLAAALNNPRYIWTTRRNKVRQAISLWRAQQTGAWVANTPWLGSFQTTEPRFDFERIDLLVQDLEMRERSWRWFFNYYGLQPLEVVYEDLVADPAASLRQVLAFLEIPIPGDLVYPSPQLRAQADHMSDSWAERYQATAASL